jgi:hypothetical protein
MVESDCSCFGFVHILVAECPIVSEECAASVFRVIEFVRVSAEMMWSKYFLSFIRTD